MMKLLAFCHRWSQAGADLCRSMPAFLAVLLCIAAAVHCALPAQGQEPKQSRPIRPVVSAAAIEKLVGQLGSTDYRTREEATRQLLAIGPPATEALAKAAKSDDLEVAFRSVRILESHLNAEELADQERAAQILESLAARNPSAVADMAGDVLSIYRLTQQDRAVEKLEKLGAVIESDLPLLPPGTLQVKVSASRWTGTSTDLELLKQMPNLGWVRIINVNVDDGLLQTLSELGSGPKFAIVEPRIEPKAAEANPTPKVAPVDGPIALPTNRRPAADPGSEAPPPAPAKVAANAPEPRKISQSRLVELDLFGTGISEEAAEKLTRVLPNVHIDKRNGALLGVEGMPGLNTCAINDVRAGTAAAEADIRPGDEITMFDGTPVHNFEEFTKNVSTKKPGDVVKLELKRGGEAVSKQLTLGRWEE